jgi:dihydroorotate dehydrogenase
MIDAGANLVQIYTSFVYRGPFAARKIAAELDARRR